MEFPIKVSMIHGLIVDFFGDHCMGILHEGCDDTGFDIVDFFILVQSVFSSSIICFV